MGMDRSTWRTATLVMAVAGMGLVTQAQAGTLYYDRNGATAGGTGTSGYWSGSNWTEDAAGTSATHAYVANSDVVFSAGSDAVGTTTVTVSSPFAANSITMDDGSVSLILNTAGALTVGDGGITVNNSNALAANMVLKVSVPLTMSSQIALTGSANTAMATLQVTGDNNLSNASISLRNYSRISSDSANARTISNAIGLDGGTSAFVGGQGNVGALTFTGPLSVNGSYQLNSDCGTNASQQVTFAGGTTLKGNLTISPTKGSGTGVNTTIFSGAIGEDGSARRLTKVGNGVLQLAHANSYSGGTSITAGTLQVTSTGDLGLGDVTVSGGTLQLDNFNAIADTATLNVSGTGVLNLNFAGTETVSQVVADQTYTSGVFGSLTNTTPGITQVGWISGSGLIAVPEPASLSLLGIVSLGMLSFEHR